MGTSTDAILAFGYDLGDSPDFGLDEDSVPTWYDDEIEGFADAATRRLLDASGFTERYEDDRPGYDDREREALAALGVEVVQHCSDSAPEWILAAKVITAPRGYPEVISLPDLADNLARWEERLAWAVDSLQLKVPDGRPEWLLASDWGV